MPFYARNLSLFVLPLLAGYFAWKRRTLVARLPLAAVAIRGGRCFCQRFPIRKGQSHPGTHRTAPSHRTVAGRRYRLRREATGAAGEGRMDFIRFSGEFFIYYVLIALGGGVFMVFTLFMFSAIGPARLGPDRVLVVAVRGHGAPS